MRLLTFYELTHLARAFGAFVRDEPRVTFTVASNRDEVEKVLSTSDVEGVIVPRVSIPVWWDVEPRLAHPVVVPRIIAVTREPGWTAQYVDELGFDGLLVIDTDESPRQLVDAVERLVRTAPTRGSRAPQNPELLDAHPDLIETVGGDPINLQILSLLAIGRGDQEIGRAVFLSHQTVRNRVSQMLDRSGMRNRTELMIHYLHHTSVNPESLRRLSSKDSRTSK